MLRIERVNNRNCGTALTIRAEECNPKAQYCVVLVRRNGSLRLAFAIEYEGDFDLRRVIKEVDYSQGVVVQATPVRVSRNSPLREKGDRAIVSWAFLVPGEGGNLVRLEAFQVIHLASP